MSRTDQSHYSHLRPIMCVCACVRVCVRESFMYHISFYVYVQQGAIMAEIFLLRIDPAASKACCAPYNMKKLYIDVADPLFLLLQK